MMKQIEIDITNQVFKKTSMSVLGPLCKRTQTPKNHIFILGYPIECKFTY